MNHRAPLLTASLLITLVGSIHAAPAAPTGIPAVVNLAEINGANGIRFTGLGNNDQAGFSVAPAGDFNGDGIDDVIIAAPYAVPDKGDVVEQAFIVFGTSAGLPSPLNLFAIDGTNGVRINAIPRIFGDYTGNQMAVASAGDINGDKISDVIIGAPFANVGKDAYTGQVYVVFGKNTARTGNFGPTIEVSDLDGTNGFVVNGITLGDQIGVSVASAGDFNADKIGDIIIGAPYADPTSPIALGGVRANAGRSFIIFGKNTARDADFPASFDLTTLNGANGLVINGVDPGDRSGTSVASAGDVNGDKVTDIIIGAEVANGGAGAGAAYIVFGRKSRPSAPIPAFIELAGISGTNGFRVDGIDDLDFTGHSVASAGDINADKISDFIIGAYRANDQAGEAYVIFGRKTPFPNPLTVSTLDGTNGFFVRANMDDDSAGCSVAPLGDFNGDKITDLIVGARGFNFFSGSAFVIFGKNTARNGPFPATFLPGTIDGTNGMRFDGIDNGDQAGFSVASAGDFNDDGRADLIIGAPIAGGQAGEACIVFGPAPEVQVAFEGIIALSNPVLNDGGTLDLSSLVGPLNLGDTYGLTFAINNLGLADLSVTKLKAPKGFVVAVPPAASVDAQDDTSFVLTITPTRAGEFTGKVSFTTNDADEKKYDFNLEWTVVESDVVAAAAAPAARINVDLLPDLNNDWILNLTDVALMLRAIAENDPAADLNDDDIVNTDDLVILLSTFGQPPH